MSSPPTTEIGPPAPASIGDADALGAGLELGAAGQHVIDGRRRSGEAALGVGVLVAHPRAQYGMERQAIVVALEQVGRNGAMVNRFLEGAEVAHYGNER